VVADDGMVEALGAEAKGKKMLIKHDVSRNINPASRTIQTLVALMHRIIAQEHTLNGLEIKLMIVIWAQIWPALIAKHTKKSVIG
jgi:hypothetical protein